MMICYDCRETFEQEETKWHTEPHGELVACCPHCGSTEIEEAEYCEICGKPHCADDLTYGVCDECIESNLTYKSFQDFALNGFMDDECSVFEEFMFCSILGLNFTDIPNGSSKGLKELFLKHYKDLILIDKCCVASDLLDKISIFIMHVYKSEFAEWLVSKKIQEKR